MSKFCPMYNQATNCTDNCTACLEEELPECKHSWSGKFMGNIAWTAEILKEDK